MAILGRAANFLCLIHCLGMGLIAVIAPGLGTLLTWKLSAYRVPVEMSLLSISFIAGYLALKRFDGATWVGHAFFVFAFLCLILGIFEIWNFFHLSLVCMALTQLYILIAQSNEHASDCAHHH